MLERFPESFMWGATLHSHCVEGEHFDSNWWRWEQRPGNIGDGSNSQYGVDHWNRYGDDIRLAGEFGMNTLLITFEWSRIQPSRDVFDEGALRHYQDVLEACGEHGITAICAMQHVTLPQWMAAKGGWSNSESPEWFRDYAKRIVEELGELCGYWIPVHEGMRGLVEGYQQGHWPPERRSPGGLEAATRHQVAAHGFAYTRIKECCPDAQVGLSVRAGLHVPGNPYSAWDARIALREGRRNNDRMLDELAAGSDEAPIDFLGVSYFGQRAVSMRWRSVWTSFVEYLGGDGDGYDCMACAEGFGELLDSYGSYSLPIFVLGNGCAHVTDEEQCGYLLDHVEVVREAIARGVDIRGYVYHSLLNGFEWDQGYARRYGLMVVDRERMTRSPNSIALLYKELCETGMVRDAMVAKFCPERMRTREDVVS